MTEEELKYFTINYIDKKIEESENPNFIKYTFYELKIKNNMSDVEIEFFLKINRNYFEKKGYKVYFTYENFIIDNVKVTVKSNELMIAVKEKEDKTNNKKHMKRVKNRLRCK